MGPLELSHDPRAAAAALDLAAGSLHRDGSVLWSHDGIDRDTFALIAALGKLAAMLAATLALDRQCRGESITAEQVLEAIRAEQPTATCDG
jgi:hypothetical protein